MLYLLLKFTHILGAVLIGGGLISVWLSDLRSRQLRELPQFSEAVRNIAVFYDGVVHKWDGSLFFKNRCASIEAAISRIKKKLDPSRLSKEGVN